VTEPSVATGVSVAVGAAVGSSLVGVGESRTTVIGVGIEPPTPLIVKSPRPKKRAATAMVPTAKPSTAPKIIVLYVRDIGESPNINKQRPRLIHNRPEREKVFVVSRDGRQQVTVLSSFQRSLFNCRWQAGKYNR
jgi:hypothetical protein